MENDILPGAMTMVNIDGAKVKLLRESQGLTQLYLATAVQVTTDTISRWENKRYPSIKKENGLNLAEALGVELEDLLETTAVSSPPKAAGVKASSFKRNWPLLILSATIAAIIGAVSLFFIHSPSPVALSAERILPAHCIPGQPFPVIIKVTGAPAGSTALILKEEFPKNAKIIKTVPAVNVAGIKHKEIKWLKKIEEKALFSYVLHIEKQEADTLLFNGNIAINRSSANTLPISGDTKISLGEHHWADSNGDNIISDNEILTVYDQYSEIEGLGLDIDLIEEIWLGSGYNWDKKTSSFEILD